jgi:cell division transport system ATP-binding protein
MISFNKVSKIYGDKAALEDISFEIEPGEFVFILGTSGSGKTTVRKLLIHEIEATSGEITVGEFNVTSMNRREIPTLRQQIGVVFQDYQLLSDRTAAENIALSLEIANKSQKAIDKTVPQLLALIGLADRGHLFPNQLSGGEAQRVVIARALATDPAVLFADEPTGNLDKENAFSIVDLLQKINRHGTTVIMATHDPDMVNHVKSRTINLKEGMIESDTKPVNKEVKDEAEANE